MVAPPLDSPQLAIIISTHLRRVLTALAAFFRTVPLGQVFSNKNHQLKRVIENEDSSPA